MKTHTSIIPEEYEPYSTGKWSVNPHAAALLNSSTNSFANVKREIEREFNMYQKVENQSHRIDKLLTDKKIREWRTASQLSGNPPVKQSENLPFVKGT